MRIALITALAACLSTPAYAAGDNPAPSPTPQEFSDTYQKADSARRDLLLRSALNSPSVPLRVEALRTSIKDGRTFAVLIEDDKTSVSWHLRLGDFDVSTGTFRGTLKNETDGARSVKGTIAGNRLIWSTKKCETRLTVTATDTPKGTTICDGKKYTTTLLY